MRCPRIDSEIASEQIQKQHVPEQIPRAVVQQHGGKKLPAIRLAHAALTEGEVVANESRIVILQDKLCDESDDICGDDREQSDALLLRPSAREGRWLSTGEPHITRLSQTDFLVDLEKEKPSFFPSISCWNEHAQLLFLYLKFDRTLSNQLAVDFHWHIFVARDAQSFRLKIFDLRQTDRRS